MLGLEGVCARLLYGCTEVAARRQETLPAPIWPANVDRLTPLGERQFEDDLVHSSRIKKMVIARDDHVRRVQEEGGKQTRYTARAATGSSSLRERSMPKGNASVIALFRMCLFALMEYSY